MSLNTRTNNAGSNPFTVPANAVSSFIQAPIENLKNSAVNVANSIKNTASNVSSNINQLSMNGMMKNLSKPLNESINGAIEKGDAGLISIPIMLTLGMLIILFILFIVFRNQIMLGAELLWAKIKSWFSPSQKETPPVVPSPEQAISNSQIEKILPTKKEVFNIADNQYTYADEEALCKALGAELAT